MLNRILLKILKYQTANIWINNWHERFLLQGHLLQTQLIYVWYAGVVAFSQKVLMLINDLNVGSLIF